MVIAVRAEAKGSRAAGGVPGTTVPRTAVSRTQRCPERRRPGHTTTPGTTAARAPRAPDRCRFGHGSVDRGPERGRFVIHARIGIESVDVFKPTDLEIGGESGNGDTATGAEGSGHAVEHGAVGVGTNRSRSPGEAKGTLAE